MSNIDMRVFDKARADLAFHNAIEGSKQNSMTYSVSGMIKDGKANIVSMSHVNTIEEHTRVGTEGWQRIGGVWVTIASFRGGKQVNE